MVALYPVTVLLLFYVDYYRLGLLETGSVSLRVKELAILIPLLLRIHHRLVDVVGRILQTIFSLSSVATPGGFVQDHCWVAADFVRYRFLLT